MPAPWLRVVRAKHDDFYDSSRMLACSPFWIKEKIDLKKFDTEENAFSTADKSLFGRNHLLTFFT